MKTILGFSDVADNIKKEVVLMATWRSIRKELNFSEDAEEIRLEKEIIRAGVKARQKQNLSQRKLSELSGIPKTTIARIESNAVTPQVSTLIKYLNAIGYRIKIEPKKKVRENYVAEDQEKYIYKKGGNYE